MHITLIGSGNVATHMGAAFKNAGHRIVQVFSPSLHNASLLAYHLGAEAIDDLADVNADTDIFIIAIKDDAIGPIAEVLARHQKLMVHTSGASSLNVLRAFTDLAGVFYPLQTFSKIKEVDFKAVPLCIEATDDDILTTLLQLAATISKNVHQISSANRKILHLAAVFACNFPNYLYGIARHLLASGGMEFDLLKPLIMETAQKVQDQLPDNVQTGPAVRNDKLTMNAHLQLLQGQPYFQDVYSLLSQGIIKNNNGNLEDK